MWKVISNNANYPHNSKNKIDGKEREGDEEGLVREERESDEETSHDGKY